ncbi:MAG: RDD family protein [Victivallaceae bacterium]|nr:RDD family protein [Victivallaceae bacterium]
MAENWYYSIDEKNHGPLSFIDMKRLVADHIIQADTLVWNEQLADWLPAQDTEIASLLNGGGMIDVAGRHHCSVCGKNFVQNELIDMNGSLTCAGCKPQMLRMMQSGTSSLGGVTYAGFWIRFGATWLDGFIVGGINLAIGFVLSRVMGEGNANVDIAEFVINVLIGFFYVVVMIATKGATLGQMAVHIQTINADGTTKISWGKSIGRYFAYQLSAILLGIGFLMVAFDSQKRALHDMICSTRVVYTNK